MKIWEEDLEERDDSGGIKSQKDLHAMLSLDLS